MNIKELTEYYYEGFITFKEWFSKFIKITNEENIDETIAYLKEDSIEWISDLYETVKKYPDSDEGWKNVISVQSYCGTETVEQIRERRKKEAQHFRIIVTLLKDKLKNEFC